MSPFLGFNYISMFEWIEKKMKIETFKHKLKTLRTDNGGEYNSKRFE